MESRKQYLRKQLAEKTARVDEALPVIPALVAGGRWLAGKAIKYGAKKLAKRAAVSGTKRAVVSGTKRAVVSGTRKTFGLAKNVAKDAILPGAGGVKGAVAGAAVRAGTSTLKKGAEVVDDTSDALADVMRKRREAAEAKKKAEEDRKKAEEEARERKDEALHTAYFNFATSLMTESLDAFERTHLKGLAVDGNIQAQKKLEADVKKVKQGLQDREDAPDATKPKKKGSNFVNSQKRKMRRYLNNIPRKVVGGVGTAVKRSLTTPFRAMKGKGKPGKYKFDHTEYQRIGSIIAEKSAAWTRSEGKNPSGGLNAKGVASYRAQNPGSKLKTAVTTKPSKLKKGSKAAKRRKSFCARMKGMRKRQKSSNNTGKDRLSLSLKKWNC